MNFDLSTFNTWVAAYLVHDKTAMRLAQRRFTANFDRAFNAWIATHPATNPHAPRGPRHAAVQAPGAGYGGRAVSQGDS